MRRAAPQRAFTRPESQGRHMSAADFPSMTTAEIRSAFLDFFEGRGLKLFPSSSLVPDDPSLLLANAGMNQFKQYYQGKKTMESIGACSCQKCVRTNDIDAIGLDGRHLSFFEMLGDFSFGGVSKQQACTWAFELITKVFKLPVERLYFTVFTDDDETHDVWRSLGVAEDHISRLGEDDNFWAAGPTGPCGPCSEIYYDQGEEFGCGKPTCSPSSVTASRSSAPRPARRSTSCSTARRSTPRWAARWATPEPSPTATSPSR